MGEGKEKGAHLEADDVPLLPLHVELVELVELHVEDPGEPVPQRDVPLAGPIPRSLGGGRRRERRGGGLGGPQVIDELLEGLVGEVLVPPRRQRLLQVVPEILPELHPRRTHCIPHSPSRIPPYPRTGFSSLYHPLLSLSLPPRVGVEECFGVRDGKKRTARGGGGGGGKWRRRGARMG
jgi:hypothetical protein